MPKKVTAAILIHDNQILIAQRKATDKHNAGKWEFPGGKIEAGETPEECLIREMQEEFQIKVSVRQFFGETLHQYDFGQIHLMAYLACWTNGKITATEHDDYKWIPVDELSEFDFAPADIPLVKKLLSEGLIELS